MERDNVITVLKDYIEREPVRFFTRVKLLVVLIPASIGISAENPVFLLLSALFYLAVEVFTESLTRSKVAPTIVVEKELQTDVEFQGMVEDYV